MNQQIPEQQAIEGRQKYVTAFNDTMIKGVFSKLRDKERSKESAYVFNLIFRIPLKDEADGMHLYREKGLSFL